LPRSETAEIRAIAAAGETGHAGEKLRALITRLFALPAENLMINADPYSLNSLNGFFESGTEKFFFKFHQEENEEAMSGEYYRAGILAAAGLPVDMPLHVSTQPGEQILVYRRRDDPRFADILSRLDTVSDPALHEAARAAERGLADRIFETYSRTLHPITPAQSAAEPIHRLFHHRLTDPATGRFPGGRYAGFYIGGNFAFPGLELDWEELKTLRFSINGIEYRDTLESLFAEAAAALHPAALAGAGGVVAHGDAHNANVWFQRRGGAEDALALFDPAFAGAHIPTLLAEVKATFHNIFAHPFWLYDPQAATAQFCAAASRRGDRLHVETDWRLSRIREDLLAIKAAHIWRPLLRLLRARALLPPDWRRTVKLALFLCPTLVMNLRAGMGGHTPASSAIGFAAAIMAGSEPSEPDIFSDFLDRIDPV
jgi:hypothetical protein